MLLLLLKFLFHVNKQMMDVTEVMLEQLMNGFITITLLTKLVLLIKLLEKIMVLDVQLKSNVETVSQIKDAGLKKELKFMESHNSEML